MAALNGIFVTGTDTDVGKTEISLGLMAYYQQQGLRVLGMKPVATGGQPGPEGLRNGDAECLLTQGSESVPYEWVNPYCFEPAIAPHLAAQEVGEEIDFTRIGQAFMQLSARADLVIVEGIGGWRVPLGIGQDVETMAEHLGLPVVLVIGLQLGCLNLGLLSAEVLGTGGLPFLGWVANTLDPDMPALAGNLEALQQRIPVPYLGQVPYLAESDPERVADALVKDYLPT